MAENLDLEVSSVGGGDDEPEELGALDAGGTGQPNAPAGPIEAVPGITVPESVQVQSLTPPDLTGLRDAAEASFPPMPRIESVIGTDERVRIRNTDDYPWRAHASLLVTARDGSQWIGTAFFISPRVLATAGHNLWFNTPLPNRAGWASSITVMPGRDGDDLPFGSANATRFYSVRGWTENADDEYDYGAIVLDEPIGSQTGWFGFGSYSDSTLTGLTGNISGYPGTPGNGAEQWYMARSIASVSARKVFYSIDTSGGQSGSAVYRIRDGSRYAFGIHAYGVGNNPLNSATRITRGAFDNLKTWKDRHP